MQNYNLSLLDTQTELGFVAEPAGANLEDFMFDFANLHDDIDEINEAYGTKFDIDFFNVKDASGESLFGVRNNLSEVKIGIKMLPEIEISDGAKAYVGGISMPRRRYLYIESHKLDRRLKESYAISEMRPRIVKCVNFIPIDQKYRPNLF